MPNIAGIVEWLVPNELLAREFWNFCSFSIARIGWSISRKFLLILVKGLHMSAVGSKSCRGNSLVIVLAFLMVFSTFLRAQDGTLDPSFGTGGKYVGTSSNGLAFGTKTAIAVQPDGKIIVGGTFQKAIWTFGVMRFTANGTLDQTFGTLGLS